MGMCRETVFEQLEVSYRKRMAGLRKLRSEHRKWRRWERTWKHAVESRLKKMEAEEWTHDDEPDTSTKNAEYPSRDRTPLAIFGRILPGFKPKNHHNLAFRHCGQVRGITYGHPGTHLNIEALSPPQLEAAAVEAGIPLDAFFKLRQNFKLRDSISMEPPEDMTATILQFFRRPNTIPLENEPVSPISDEMEKMSGMLTKFALATTGIAVGANRTPQVQRSDTSGSIKNPAFQMPAVTATQSARDRGEVKIPMRPVDLPNFKQDVESEEAKAFWAKVTCSSSVMIPVKFFIS